METVTSKHSSIEANEDERRRKKNEMVMRTTNAVDGKSAVAQVELCACACCKPSQIHTNVYTSTRSFHFIRIKPAFVLSLHNRKLNGCRHTYMYRKIEIAQNRMRYMVNEENRAISIRIVCYDSYKMTK